ncbi:tyrosine-type recombinase/integrase [Lentisalinibacter sediminis]|uniref:tyrosine-type recombinase/integrase n=1 Tax=Lentisalinibacter sediminis TaxID=2992237 RepID=UPI00386A4C1C
MPRQQRHLLTALNVRSIVQKKKACAKSDGGGLTLTVSANGYASWILRYSIGGKRREYTIGPEADFPLAEARREAQELRQRVARGEDISATKRLQKALSALSAAPETFSELFQLWYDRTIKDRYQHPERVIAVFTNWINPKLGDLPLDGLRGSHILNCLEAVKAGGARTVALDALRHIRSALDYAVMADIIQENPAKAISARQIGVFEVPRDRYLSLEEVHHLLVTMAENRSWFGRNNELAVRLLLLLGVRKRELTEARWAELALGGPRWQIPANRSKTGRAIMVPLPELAASHFRELKTLAAGSEWIFPARRRGTRKLGHIGRDTLNSAVASLPLEIDHFVLHDLRRTMRSHLSELGVRVEVAEKCLNHKLKGVLGVYDQYDFLPERREALSRWADVIALLDSGNLKAAKEHYHLDRVVRLQKGA